MIGFTKSGSPEPIGKRNWNNQPIEMMVVSERFNRPAECDGKAAGLLRNKK